MEKASLQKHEYLTEELGMSQLFKEKRKKRSKTKNSGSVWNGNKISPFLISFDYGYSAPTVLGTIQLDVKPFWNEGPLEKAGCQVVCLIL